MVFSPRMQMRGTQPQYIKVFATLKALFVIFFTSFTVLSIIFNCRHLSILIQKSLSKRYQQSMYRQFTEPTFQISPLTERFQVVVNEQEEQYPEDYFELTPEDDRLYFFQADFEILSRDEDETRDCQSSSEHIWDMNANNNIFINYQEFENSLSAENGLQIENEDTDSKISMSQDENQSEQSSIQFGPSFVNFREENKSESQVRKWEEKQNDLLSDNFNNSKKEQSQKHKEKREQIFSNEIM